MANPEKEIREVLGSFPDGRLHTFVSLGASEMIKRGLNLPSSVIAPAAEASTIEFGTLVNPLIHPEDEPDSVLGDGRIVVSHKNREVEVDGNQLDFSNGRKRFDTLAVLAANAGKIVSRKFLYDTVWHQSVDDINQYFPIPPTNKVDNLIIRLRTHLGKTDLGSPSKGAILTVNFVGWVALPHLQQA